MKKLIVLFLLPVSFLSAQTEIQSLLYYNYDEAGNRKSQLPYCPLCCPNNLLVNGSFEQAKAGWKMDTSTISSAANGGELAVALCQEGSNTPSETTQRVIAWAGATYNLSAYARTPGRSSGEVRLIFLNAREKPVGDSIVLEVKTETYQQYTLTGIAPDSVRYLDVKCVSNSAGCLYVDDVCLTADKFQVDADCAENRLSNAGFLTEDFMSWWRTLESEVENFTAKNCSPFGGGGGQTIAAEVGQQYTLKTTVQVTEKQFDAYVGMAFLNEEGTVIANPIKKIIYTTELEEITLTGIAPEGTVALEVFFTKYPGNGCLLTRDWCVTSTAEFEPPLENTLQLYAYRVKYKSTLVWFDNTWTTDKNFTLERWDEEGNYIVIAEVAESSRLQNGRYQISDPKPEQGFNTYRVRMNLEEDYFMTSNRATLWFPKAEQDYILVPNPATHKVDLIFSEAISANTEGTMIEIYDINGRLQRQSALDQEELLSYYRMFLDDLASGIYVVVLRQNGQKPITRKLVLNDY